jgi:hypothetical protein
MCFGDCFLFYWFYSMDPLLWRSSLVYKYFMTTTAYPSMNFYFLLPPLARRILGQLFQLDQIEEIMSKYYLNIRALCSLFYEFSFYRLTSCAPFFKECVTIIAYSFMCFYSMAPTLVPHLLGLLYQLE